MTAAAKTGPARQARLVAAGDEGPPAGEQGLRVGHAATEIFFDLGQRIDIGDPGFPPDGDRQQALATDHDGLFPILPAEGQDAGDQFSVEALAVEAAFSGDDKVGLGNLFFQAGHLAEEFPAGHKLGAEFVEGGAHAARRAAARQGGVQPGLGRKAFHPALQPFQHRRIRPLLRAIDHGRAIGAQQGIVHVAGDGYYWGSAPNFTLIFIDFLKRFQQALSPIIGSRTSNSNHNSLTPMHHCFSYHHAETVGRRLFGIPLGGGEHRQAADFGHLDKGLPVAVEQEHRGLDGTHQRIEGIDAYPAAPAAERSLNHFHRTVPAVGHRELDDAGRVPADHLPPDRRLERFGHFRRRKRSLEFIGNNQNIAYLCHLPRTNTTKLRNIP